MNLYIVHTNLPFDLGVTLDDSMLSLTVTPPAGDEPREPTVRNIDLESLRNRPDFGDHALYTIYDRSSAGGELVSEEVANSVCNLYAMTYASKVEASTYHRLVTQIFPLAVIYVPLASSPLSQWSIGVRVNESATVTASANLVKVPAVSLPGAGESSIFPLVRFDAATATVDADGQLEVPFHLTDASGAPLAQGDADVYLDATAGNLVQRRVRTVNGRGSAIFRPDGLPRGSLAKIKAGFKFFSGTDDCMVSIA